MPCPERHAPRLFIAELDAAINGPPKFVLVTKVLDVPSGYADLSYKTERFPTPQT